MKSAGILLVVLNNSNTWTVSNVP